MEISTIEEILLKFSYKGEDLKGAEKAFNELYLSYSKLVFSVVRDRLIDIGMRDHQLRDAIMTNTFLKVYEKPLKFSFPEGAKNDSSFKGWLLTIAHNEMCNLMSEFFDKNQVLEAETQEVAFSDDEISDETYTSANSKLLTDALNSLPERDREILLALYTFYELGKKTPSKTLDGLCVMYGTTRVNIRKIKQRSEEKIKEYCLKNSQLKPVKSAK
jgi:RNA polymerase sigma factor (sigma-70 family)